MGDRGNIAIVFDEKRTKQVWIYSHWGGSDMPELLREGLERGESRWGDDGYLARIIVCAVIPEGQYKETTGYGISCELGDNEHPITVVDMPNRLVFSIKESELEDYRVPANYKPKKPVSFSDYIAANKVTAK